MPGSSHAVAILTCQDHHIWLYIHSIGLVLDTFVTLWLFGLNTACYCSSQSYSYYCCSGNAHTGYAKCCTYKVSSRFWLPVCSVLQLCATGSVCALPSHTCKLSLGMLCTPLEYHCNHLNITVLGQWAAWLTHKGT